MTERIRLHTDEHVPKAVVKGLRERGVDVLTVAEAGMLGASDEEHLAFALREERVVFTQDDDSFAYMPRERNTRVSSMRDSRWLLGR